MERARRAISGLTALAFVSMAACATYQPRPSRYIVHDADDVYHRDGAEFRVGLLGGGAQLLVARDPRALEHVRRQQHLLRVGWTIYALGLATIIAGGAIATEAAPRRAQTPLLFGTTGLGLGVSMLGFAWIVRGNAALVDAVNVYNDDLDERAREGQP